MLLQAISLALTLLSAAAFLTVRALDLDHDLNSVQEEHSIGQQQKQEHFSHQWAVHIPGGKATADIIAARHGFQNTGQIFPDYYHFVHRKVAKRSTEPCVEYFDRLESEPEVRWHAQQVVKRRTKRDFLQLSSKPLSGGRSRAFKRSQSITFNDPRWPAMWYLNRGPGLDMNVQDAWGEGITGKGIVVTILDDGLEKDHPDIQRNYDPLASFDVNSLDMDPMPTYDLTDSNRHGTRCAGEVAAEANNSICAVGVAYEASVGGVRMLDGDVTDAVEARSLSHNPQHIDIYSASWGPDDDGKTVDGPGELATRAFIEGITKGRSGKGSIFVWASGNGGRDHDNCNCDGYTNSIWTLSISSATENGLVPWYSEACSSTLATTYSSGGTGEKQIVTIDLHHSCTSSHTGTSASAPLAAGICALALQANTNLTWRDMQHIVVRTARPFNLISSDWATNGVGRNVSHSFGYGLMDATAMVRLSRNWRTVPEQNRCEIRAPYADKNIPAKSKVTLDLKVSDCAGVNILEHVQAKVTLTSGRRGDLQIYLVSPSGTRSLLLAHRRHDLNRSGFTDWPFMTVHCWGESPIGKWTLEIHNEGRYPGKLQTWSIVAHGVTKNPNDQKNVQFNGNAGAAPRPIGNFDDSENRLLMEPSHAHSPPLAAANANELEVVADVSSTMTSSANSPSSSAGMCAKLSGTSGKCLECIPGLYLLHGECMENCPDNFFPRSTVSKEEWNINNNNNNRNINTNTNNNGIIIKKGGICVSCHYSCRTCIGPYDDECTSCYSDSNLLKKQKHVINRNRNELITSHCYPVKFLNSIEKNNFWYTALLVTVIGCIIFIIFLLIHNWILRNRIGGGGGNGLLNGNSSSSSSSWLERRTYSRISREDEEDGDGEDSPPFENEIEYVIPVSESPIHDKGESISTPPTIVPLLHGQMV